MSRYAEACVISWMCGEQRVSRVISFPVAVLVQLRTGDMVVPVSILAVAFVPLMGVVMLRRLSAEQQFAIVLPHAGAAVAALSLLMFFGEPGVSCFRRRLSLA